MNNLSYMAGLIKELAIIVKNDDLLKKHFVFLEDPQLRKSEEEQYFNVSSIISVDKNCEDYFLKVNSHLIFRGSKYKLAILLIAVETINPARYHSPYVNLINNKAFYDRRHFIKEELYNISDIINDFVSCFNNFEKVGGDKPEMYNDEDIFHAIKSLTARFYNGDKIFILKL